MQTIRKTKPVYITVCVALAFNLIVVKSFAQEIPAQVREVGFVFSNLNSFGLRYKCGNENTLLRLTALSFNGSSTTNSYDDYSYNGIAPSVASTPSSSVGAGLNIGFEKRKRINAKSYFYWGIDWINSYSESKSNTTTPGTYTTTMETDNVYTYQTLVYENTNVSNTWTISSGLGVVLGVAYKLSDSFSVMAELIPSASYKYTKTVSTITTNSIEYFGSAAGYSPVPNTANQTTINSGITYSLTNAAASITIAYRLRKS